MRQIFSKRQSDFGDMPRSPGLRAFVGGVLYVEGIIVLLVGCTMMFGYWPPYAVGEARANPVSLFGAWITGIAVTYMILVGVGLFIYNLLRPAMPEQPDPLRVRAHRYKQLRHRGEYLFDETIASETKADEAHLARQLI